MENRRPQLSFWTKVSLAMSVQPLIPFSFHQVIVWSYSTLPFIFIYCATISHTLWVRFAFNTLIKVVGLRIIMYLLLNISNDINKLLIKSGTYKKEQMDIWSLPFASSSMTALDFSFVSRERCSISCGRNRTNESSRPNTTIEEISQFSLSFRCTGHAWQFMMTWK